MRIATWNLEWPTSRRQQAARVLLEQMDADVVVTTEDHARPWAQFPHVVDAGNDWGYSHKRDRRKVMVWSRTPWRRIDLATLGATNGRLVAAATTVETEYTIVGVCIPWAAAHVSTGCADRRRWDEHVEFCGVLGDVLERLRDRGPVVVAGDFNQTVPRHRQPVYVWKALQAALGHFEIVTGPAFHSSTTSRSATRCPRPRFVPGPTSSTAIGSPITPVRAPTSRSSDAEHLLGGRSAPHAGMSAASARRR